MIYLPVYESEYLDFEATYQKLSDPLLGRKYAAHVNVAGKDPDSGGAVDAGSLQFILYPTQIKILISPKGPRHSVQVFSWVNEKEKETYLPMLQNVLVPISGKEAVKLHPVSMVISGKILYPGPREFSLPWCQQKTRFLISTFVKMQNVLAIILTVCFCVMFYALFLIPYAPLGIGFFVMLWPGGYIIIALLAVHTSAQTLISLLERKQRNRANDIGSLFQKHI
jgi:hypothetical protein